MSSDAGAGARECRPCPDSGALSAPVRLATVKALVTSTALRRLSPRAHYFCTDPTCDVVYFDEAGSRYVSNEIRVPVWNKEVPGRRVFCYCFGETEAAMRHEGAEAVIARIRANVEAGRCACNARNPSGHCCLQEMEQWCREAHT